MAHAFLSLRRACRVRAIRHRLALGAHDRTAARRTLRRHRPLAEVFAFSRFQDRSHDFRNHFAGSAHDDHVARPYIFHADEVLVVQRRGADGDPADEHRLQHGIWIDASRAADVDFDREQFRRRFFGFVFEGDGPTRVFSDKSKFSLLLERVYLHHDAVDAIVK